MADEHEILKYSFDITDVEAKAQRILELQQQIATARGKGEQTTELESQLNREIDGLGKLGTAEKKAAGATEDLTRQKDKLALAVGLVGGRFGGAIGQIGGVVELLAAGGPHAIALGAGLVALAAGVGVLTKLAAAAKEAADEQERLNQAIVDSKRERLGTLEQVEIDLGKHGLRNAAGTQAAKSMLFGLQRTYGYQEGEAAGVTAGAVAEGLTLQEAAEAIELQGMDYSAQGPGGMRRMLEQADPADRARARKQAEGIKTTEGGSHAVSRARGYAGRTPIERVQEALQDQGEDIGIDELRRKVQMAEELEAQIEELNERVAAAPPAPSVSVSMVTPYGGIESERQILGAELRRKRTAMRDHNRYLSLYRREEGFGVVSGPPSPGLTPEQVAAQQQTVSNVTIYNHNVGSITNTGAKKLNPRRPNSGMTLSETAIQKMPH